ncbi:MAG: hypothetical protein NVS2B3_16030 [Vulcanimicrobiaceae bacterium]
MSAFSRRATAFALSLLSAASLGALVPSRASATLAAAERGVLIRYLTALERRDYRAAFAQLSDDERRYFGSARNLEAVFAADGLAVEHHTILKSTSAGRLGSLAVVRERVRFFDHARQRTGRTDADVRYGIVPSARGPAIKDPFHPWFAFAPTAFRAQVGGASVTLRKVSFYAGRFDIVATFANTGSSAVTILPYGRTLVRDERGRRYVPIRSTASNLTDRVLFEGLRLAPNARYTGTLTFASVVRFRPRRLAVTIAPALFDGGERPFDFVLGEHVVPPAS